MKFLPTPLKDAYLIELEPTGDERGFFARLFCAEEFENAGLVANFCQVNNSLSAKKGTLRGLHYQLPPSAEAKLVRCIAGAVWDLILDLRPHSATFGHSFGAQLDSKNRTMMYVPRGFAHATLTLEDNVEILYLVSDSYNRAREKGIRWNDPRFSLKWPIEPVEISTKDANWPNFNSEFHGVELLKGQK
jgi:dTDP-4-dehydrorhamnose 3,5-epimerase